MLKVLFLIPTLGHGGAERVLINLVNNINREKFDITLQTLFDEGVNKKYLNPAIRYKSFFKHAFRGNSVLLSLIPSRILYRAIIKEHYDVVISFLEGPATRIVSGCPFPDSKKIAWIHIELNTKERFKVGFRSFGSAKKAYEKMDRIVCVCDSVRSIFEQTAGVSFSNLTVLYNTIDTKEILEKSNEAIEDGSFSQDTVNVISVAKIMKTKGYDRLANVHMQLLNEGIPHRIFILGTGEEQSRIEQVLKNHHITDSFVFLGYRDNPYKYVKAADVYICSSRREGFSTAVSEALIVGTPVVSTCCSGAHELLGANNEYGIVVDNSEEGIYKGLKQMLTDRALREEYREKALQRGKQFSTEITVKAVEEMLASL